MPQMYYLPCYDFVNNIWWTITDMKLTTQSSAPLYSYLPLTPNILLTTCSYKHSICSSLYVRHQIHTHTKLHEQCQFYSSVLATFWTEWQQAVPEPILLFFQDHGPQILAGFDISSIKLTTKWQWYCKPQWHKVQRYCTARWHTVQRYCPALWHTVQRYCTALWHTVQRYCTALWHTI